MSPPEYKPEPEPDLDDHRPNISKLTDDVRRQEVCRNHDISASELKEMLQDHLGNVSVAIPTDREFTSPSRYAISMVARASSSLGVTCLGDPLVKLKSPTSLSNTN